VILGYDVSNYSGLPPDGFVWTLKNRFRLTRCIVGLQDLTIATAWAEACHTAGVELESYVETYNAGPALADQLTTPDILAWLRQYLPLAQSFTLEDTNGPDPVQGAIAAAIDAAIAHAPYPGMVVPCYTAAWWVHGYGPTLDISALAPLWVANYTGTPPQTTAGFDVDLAGWKHARCIQYAGNVNLLGVQLDLDAWES
jgi:hypothetical protein